MVKIKKLMKKIKFPELIIALVIFSFGLITGCQTSEDKKSDMSINKNKPSGEEHMEWFRDAKFGLFIHWGPYSMLGGEWNGIKQKEEQGEWIMKYLSIPVKDYRDLTRKFNPVKFDAKGWVKLAKATGMKYIVITAKHHDGFAMYHSKVTDYNIVDWTPYGRDPLKELAEACKEEGLTFCVYYSHREDWDHPGAYGNDWDYDNEWGENLYYPEKFTKYLEEKAKPQLKELLTDYGPIGLVWFDRGMYTHEQGLEFVNMVHELQPSCLVNSRVGSIFSSFESQGDYQCANDKGMPRRSDPNKTFPAGGLGDYWEAPQTLNETWGYNKFDTLWKSSDHVIKNLVEIVSRGGNYLLNIGPTGEGEIPEATVDIFTKVGPWVQRNAESIYGATANLFPPLPWGFTSNKENRIFLYVRDWPKDGVLQLPGLKNEVKSAYVLIDKSLKVEYKQEANTTILNLPINPPDNPVTVVVLEIEGAPMVDPSIVTPDKDGKMELNYLTAVTHGKTKTRFNVNMIFHITKWTEPEDYIDWVIEVKEPGNFKVNITYAASGDAEGRPYEIINGDESIKSSVISGGDYNYYEFPIGYLNFPKAGKYTIKMRPTTSGDNYLMYLRSLNLSPVENVKTEGWGVN